LTCADGAILPYPDDAFEITFCHYVLLWVTDPVRVLREMRRVTAPSGFVIAFAEPDYGSRNSHPAELEQLARLQNAALERQGAALRRGAELERNFRSAGIPLVETGILRREGPRAAVDSGWEDEWRVLEADLAETVSPADLARIKEIDRRAVALGEHALNVPTHFAWGQV
jgi:SAM-dependent methyltransferase